MNVKEYLCRYHNTLVKIEQLETLVAEYIRLANSIPGIKYDQIRVDGTRNLQAPFEKWILKALEYEQWISEMKTKLPFIKGEIISAIDKLEDEQYRIVLIYRYIDWLSWNEIAEKTYYSSATIRRWHNKALMQINISNK